MREYSCRGCGAGGFTSPGAVAMHRHESGCKKAPVASQGRFPSRSARGAKSKRGATDGEGSVLQTCVSAFEGARLEDAGRRRILNYLCDRFLPDEPVAAETEEEAA